MERGIRKIGASWKATSSCCEIVSWSILPWFYIGLKSVSESMGLAVLTLTPMQIFKDLGLCQNAI